MKLLALTFIPTGTYSDMPYRPYTALTPTAAQRHAFARQTVGGLMIDPVPMSNVANLLIRPGKHAIKPVPIPSGWGESRLAFQLMVGPIPWGDGEVNQVLTGYTDYKGVSPDGKFDPQMRLYFNRSMFTRGSSRRPLIDPCHLLSNPSGEKVPWISSAHTLLPSNIFQRIAIEDLFADGAMTDLLDSRATFAGEAIKKSRLDNGIPGVYLSRLATTYQAIRRGDFGTEEEVGDAYSYAAGAASEPSVKNDPFMLRLATLTDIMSTGSITYQELLSTLEESGDERVNYVGIKPDTLHKVGDTAEWTGHQVSVQMATLLGNAVPVLLARHQLSEVSFSASNNPFDGSFNLMTTGGNFWAQGYISFSEAFDAFRRDLRLLVLPQLTYVNGTPQRIEVTGRFTLTGDSHMTIKIDGDRTIPFCMPSFADARFAPVIGADENALRALASKLNVHLDFIVGGEEISA